MKLTHPAVVAFGIAMLLTLPVVDPLDRARTQLVYHFDGPLSIVFYPVLISIALLCILFTGLLMLARKPGRARLFLWSALMFLLPWVLLKASGLLLPWRVPHHLSLLVFLAGLTATPTLLVCWKPSFQRVFDHAQEFTATVLAFCALSGLLVLGNLCWRCWQARSTNAAMPLHHYVAAQPPPHSRVIWLILDELSYRQVYEHRFPSLDLPAFDRLAGQATVFTQVAPAGLMTEYAIPSLISALPADAMRASADGRQLYLHDPIQQRWKTFDPHQSVFQDALDRGYSTRRLRMVQPLLPPYVPGPRLLLLDQSQSHAGRTSRRIKPFSAIPSPHFALLGTQSCTSSPGANRQISPGQTRSRSTYPRLQRTHRRLRLHAQRQLRGFPLPAPAQSPIRTASTTATHASSPPAHPPTSTTSPSPTPTSPTFALNSNNATNGTLPPSSSWETTPGAPRPSGPSDALLDTRRAGAPATAASSTTAPPTFSSCPISSNPRTSTRATLPSAPAPCSTQSWTTASNPPRNSKTG